MQALEQRRRLSAGQVDSSFGTDGVVIGSAKLDLNNAQGNEQISAIAQQSDGRVLMVGSDESDIFVARTTAKGQLDPSYGHLGLMHFSFGDLQHTVSAVTVDSSDRLIVTATVTTNDAGAGSQFAVARITTSGKLDTRFSGDGETTISFGQKHATAYAVTIDALGRILVAGSSDNGRETGRMAVSRLTAGGRLDPQFSVDGKQTIDCETGNDAAYDIFTQKDGSVFLTGELAKKSREHNFAVVRLKSDGQLDNDFDGNGIAAVDFGGNDDASTVLVQSDGKIVVGGTSLAPPPRDGQRFYSPVMARFTSSGALDTSFSGDGRLSASEWPIYGGGLLKVLWTKTGAYRAYTSTTEFRVSSSGVPDLKFGGDNGPGKDFSGSAFTSGGVIIHDDGSIVLVANIDDLEFGGVRSEFFFAVIDSNDETVISTSIAFDHGISDLAVDPSGKLVDSSNASDAFCFYRFSPSGKVDPTFGDAGRSVFNSAVKTLRRSAHPC
jgi:uncharacterized delta-60 repeat protein